MIHVCGFDVGRAVLLRDLMLSLRRVGRARILPPRKRSSTRVAYQQVATSIAVQVSEIQIVRTAIGTFLGHDVTCERVGVGGGKLEPGKTLGKLRPHDAVG